MVAEVQRFGPYVILDRIGDGGMAEIFLAKKQGYSGFEKLIALKRILPRYSQNRTFAQMLIHEAKLAASLQHFNVVQVLELGEIDSQVYIAMEYVRGRDLAAVLSNTYRRRERLPVSLTLCIATEFMTGLDYAHRMRNSDGIPLGVIHRDISPQNILISYEGEVKVTDFGIARVISEKDGFQLPGNLHGKFGYMSPEQVLGQEIDQRSDIFSAGVVLYEMLTGQRLFRGKEHKETIKMIVSHVIPPPSTVNSEVPPSVDRVCAKALARDRNLRYQTMGALLGDLSRVVDSLPRRAATRDLAVYMRRQFGNTASGVQRSRSSESSISNFSGFQQQSRVSEISGLSLAGGSRVPIGELLISLGVISAGDLEIALAEQRARGGRLGELLVTSGTIAEDDLMRALAQQSGLPIISEKDLLGLPPPTPLLRRFPREAAEATMMLPIQVSEEDHSVRLAVNDPYDDRAILETKVVLGVNEVGIFLAKRAAIRAAILNWYGQAPEGEASPLEPIFAEPVEVAEPSRPVVLIADGDASVIEELVARVKEEDCEVVAVTDGKHARDVCREKHPAVALLDAALPGIDGYNILLELRSKNEDAAVFITSLRGDEDRQAKALELGADDFVVKPFQIELATAKIRREIQKRSTGRKVMSPQVRFAGVSGSLKDMTALDIAQSLELGKKTAHVVLQYGDGRTGEIGVRGGDVKSCVAGDVTGEEAFFLLVRPGDGLFRIEYREPANPPNIYKPNTYLMIEAMRRLDEASREASEERTQLALAPPIPQPPPEIPPDLMQPASAPQLNFRELSPSGDLEPRHLRHGTTPSFTSVPAQSKSQPRMPRPFSARDLGESVPTRVRAWGDGATAWEESLPGPPHTAAARAADPQATAPSPGPKATPPPPPLDPGPRATPPPPPLDPGPRATPPRRELIDLPALPSRRVLPSPPPPPRPSTLPRGSVVLTPQPRFPDLAGDLQLEQPPLDDDEPELEIPMEDPVTQPGSAATPAMIARMPLRRIASLFNTEVVERTSHEAQVEDVTESVTLSEKD